MPVLVGVILQWHLQFSLGIIITSLLCFFSAFLLFYFIRIEFRFKFQWLQGILFHLLLIAFAMFITWQKDSRHDLIWYGHYYNDSSSLILRIDEPLVEKERSFKADGYVEALINDNKIIPVKGKLLVYLSKDSNTAALCYGDRILLRKPLQAIRNSGNPGAFNYECYAAFHQTFHNVFLTANDWKLMPGKNASPFHSFIFSIRHYIIAVLKKYTMGSNNETAIAEALLIGYREDLDKDLVQAYSNAGVVHIIAISGLHLGLIYVMLAWILGKLPYIRKHRFIKVLLLLSCLWLFSILTGASGSVLRSAVMFTFILIGKNYFTQASIYNSLAGSAFLLLCYDPYFLWDVGFQLSYLALIGIVSLQQPIGKIFYIRKKWLKKCWDMASVTLAAQIATFPLCIYYFHQFPNLFFITNLLAVPLSTVILFVEILLIAVSGIHIAALYTGKLVGAMAWLMNYVITNINSFSFSVWDGIYANSYTTAALYLFIIALCYWFMQQDKKALTVAASFLMIFTGLHVLAILKLRQQKMFVVYNVPKCRAMDFVYRDQFYFMGDTALQQKGLLQNFHLKPARISLQLKRQQEKLTGLSFRDNFYNFFSKKIMLIDSLIAYEPLASKINIDIIVISKNPSLKIAAIASAIKPSVIIFDSSNSLWKIAKWKKECLALALPCFSIPEQGAFVLIID
ncbi:ComEC/Rec2 family competence protein [soil metagenome]